MRIAHVIDNLAMGGAQRVLGDMLSRWPNRDDHFEIISLGKQVTFAPQLANLPQVRLHCLDGGKWNFNVVRQAASLIEAGRFDIVHAHLAKATCAALWAQPRSRAPLVLHAHCDPDRDSRHLLLPMKMWKHRIAALVAVSEQTANIAHRWFNLPPDIVHAISNGIDFTRLQSSSEPVGLHARLGIPSDAIIVGYLGRLHPQKGITYLIQAMQQLRRQRQDIVVVLIGGGPLEGALKREAVERGVATCMHFVGPQMDLAAWMSAFSFGVLPSEFEGLPLVAIETMGLGKTMIATDVSGNSEVVVHEETGLLVPPRDPDALAQAILRLAASPQLVAQLAVRAERHVREKFSADTQGRRVRELYQQLLAQPAPGLN